ncbi:MAG: hypothetical protein QOG55_3558 [Acidobacteriaceae bacterium]|jgi:hypothetical protein|nr:hypothetical protein [Acidobacteriaceae bacterium]
MEIQEAIEERKKQIKKLEIEIEALLLAAEILKSGAKAETEKVKTQPGMAYAVLDEIGKPMHVTQISEQIKKRFSISIKANNLGVMLFRYAKRGNKFYKAQGKPNTYGLIKWQEITQRLDSLKVGTIQLST